MQRVVQALVHNKITKTKDRLFENDANIFIEAKEFLNKALEFFEHNISLVNQVPQGILKKFFQNLFLIREKNKDFYERAFKYINGIIIMYKAPPNDEGNDKHVTSITLKDDADITAVQINSNDFLKFLLNNIEYCKDDSRIDDILKKIQEKIKKEINFYKEDMRDAIEKEEKRYIKLDYTEKLKEIRNFTEKLIDITG